MELRADILVFFMDHNPQLANNLNNENWVRNLAYIGLANLKK